MLAETKAQGYADGRADAIEECLSILASAYMNQDGVHEAYRKIEKLKEQKNE